jgi:hypothetical protein
MKVDQKNRDRLAAVLRRYLAEETTSFELDEKLWEIRDASQDPTLDQIAKAIWLYYDDFKDHKMAVTKEEWDALHRLLLILESDAQVQVLRRRVWSVTQPVAAIALAGYCFFAFWLEFGYQLLPLAIPFGIVSITLDWWRRWRTPQPTARELALAPFASAAELLAVRRSVGDFVKQRYPEHMSSRQLRAPGAELMMWIPSVASWLLFAPLVLLMQILPDGDPRSMVRLSVD